MTNGTSSTVADTPLNLERFVLSFAASGTSAQPSPTRPDILLLPKHGDFKIEELWGALEEFGMVEGWKIWNLTDEDLCLSATVLDREQLAEVTSHLESGFLICLTEVYHTEAQALDIITEALGSLDIENLRIEDGIFALLDGALVQLNLSE